MSLKVTSEIGKLKSVLVHLPGPEIDRMVPSMMEELLFDDILYGNRAREEHRRFQQVLGYVADEVLEIQDLLEEVLQVPEQRGAILDDLGKTLGWGPDMDYRLRDLTAEQLAAALVTGIEKPAPEIASAASELYALPPIPNYFFQRDPLVVVGERAIRGVDGDVGAAARAAALRVRPLAASPVREPRGRQVLVPGVLGRLRQARVLRAHAPDARGRRRARAARRPARDRLLRAHREDDDRAAGRVVQEAASRRSSGSSSSRSRRRARTCTSTRSSR